MQILLPPSEGKHSPAAGSPLSLADLSFADELTAARKKALARHRGLLRAPAAPAHTIYTGVLYAALDWESLRDAGKRRAEQSIVLVSALFGALRLSDAIPAYKARPESALWRQPLSAALGAIETHLWVDCRSSTYLPLFKPPVEQTVSVRVFKTVGKQRSVITHMSKHYRGLLARHLVSQTRTPRSPEQVAEVAASQFTCELKPPTAGQTWNLDLLIPAG